MNNQAEKEKHLAAEKAVHFVKDGMIVGLGSGSTSAHAIRQIGQMVKEGLKIKGVPSSDETEKLAKECGIPLVELNDIRSIDVTLDGADEFDPYMQLIKGGGGALLREKILASVSKMNVIMVDSNKQVNRLGAFKLPVEVIPFALNAVMNRISVDMSIRIANGEPYRTDENNIILDLDISPISNLSEFNNFLINIPGVVETGLFLDTADVVIMGIADNVKVFHRNVKLSSRLVGTRG